MLFDPAFQEDQYYHEVIATNKIVDTIKQLDLKTYYHTIISSIWKVGMPCSDSEALSKDMSVLKYCEWRGMQVPCSAIFSSYPTDQGICCVFNMQAADKMFVGETYPQLISKNLQTNPSEMQAATSIQKTEPGKNKGLLVVLDSHSDALSASSLDSETQGFFGLITQTGNFPQRNLGGFDIKAGHKNTVSLSATKIDADSRLQYLDPVLRNCYFEWENSFLKIFKKYSHSNCVFECNFYYAQKELESLFPPCSPWYLPTPDNSPNICDPWQAAQMSEMMSNVPINHCKYCFVDCETTILKTRISTAPMRKCHLNNLGFKKFCNTSDKSLFSSEFLSDLPVNDYQLRFSTLPYFYRNNFATSRRKFGSSLSYGDVFEASNVEYNYLEKDLATVQIFFESAYATNIQRSPRLSWVDYYSNVGGIFGLVLGMGIITLVEIFWLLKQYLW